MDRGGSLVRDALLASPHHLRYTLFIGPGVRHAVLYDSLPVIYTAGATIDGADLHLSPRLTAAVKLVAVSARYASADEAVAHGDVGLTAPPAALRRGYRSAADSPLSRGFYDILIVAHLPLGTARRVTVNSARVSFTAGGRRVALTLPESLTLVRRKP